MDTQGKKCFGSATAALILREHGLNVSPPTVRGWIDAGRLRAWRSPSGRRYIRREDLLALIERGDLPPVAPEGGAE